MASNSLAALKMNEARSEIGRTREKIRKVDTALEEGVSCLGIADPYRLHDQLKQLQEKER